MQPQYQSQHYQYGPRDQQRQQYPPHDEDQYQSRQSSYVQPPPQYQQSSPSFEQPRRSDRSPRQLSPTLKRQLEQEPLVYQNGTQKRFSQNQPVPEHYESPRHHQPQYYPQNQGQQNFAAQEDATDNADAWAEIKQKIDAEYQKKLKLVNDEAMQKLRDHEREYQDLLEKTKFLYTQQQKQKSSSPVRASSRTSRMSTGSRADSRLSGLSNVSFLSSNQNGTNKNDRFRFFSPRAIEMNEFDQRTDMEKRNETTKIKLFYKEYCAVVKRNVTMDNQVYLVDVLDQLHFIHGFHLNDPNSNLVQILDKHREKLMVYSKSGEYSGESEDIIKNFFKICCGILNLKLKQRGHNELDDTLLKQYVSAINYEHEDENFILMDQFHTIRSLINRKAFCLNHKQIEYIHEKFKNMYAVRHAHEEKKRLEKEAQMPKKPQMQIQEPEYAQMRQSAEQGLDQESYQYKPKTPSRPKVLYQETQRQPAHVQQYQPVSATMPKKQGKRPWSGARPSSSQRGADSSGVDQLRNYAPSASKQHLFSDPANYWQHNPTSIQKAQRAPQPQMQPISGTPKQRQGDPWYEQEQPLLKTSPQQHRPRPMDQSPRQFQTQERPRQNSHTRPKMAADYKPQVRQNFNGAPPKHVPQLEEPICVLKIELDGEHVEEIRIYEGDKPDQIVEEFGQQFNLSDNAKRRLLMQISEQIEADNHQ